MKSQLIAIVTAVLVAGSGPSVPGISIVDAADKGNIEAVKQHLATDADVNAKGRQPAWAPLLQAASGGQKEMAELLISKGTDVNVLSDAGETPLDGAIAFEQLEIADLLRKYGNKTGE
ncbi:ankyrin repeat domain-containing protein [bacterium]|nr:ankyrin repeat domain-containing protein [bacterium]MDA7679744.1 ankyrin repeat domain-containing protein [bacterium]